MVAPVANDVTLAMEADSVGDRHSKISIWGDNQPFSVTVTGGASYRIRNPNGSWATPDYITGQTLLYATPLGSVSIPGKSGVAGGAVTLSDIVDITDQGHAIELRLTASETPGASVSTTWQIGTNLSGVWGVTTVEAPPANNDYDPVPLPTGSYTELVLTPALVAADAGGSAIMVYVGGAGRLAGNPRVITFAGGTYTKNVEFSNLRGTAEAPIIIRNKPGDARVRFSAPAGTTVSVDKFIFDDWCAHIIVDGLHPFTGAGSKADFFAMNDYYGFLLDNLNDGDANYSRGGANLFAIKKSCEHIRVRGVKALGRQAEIRALNDTHRGASSGFRVGYTNTSPALVITEREGITFEYCWGEGCSAEPFYVGTNVIVSNSADVPLKNPAIRKCVSVESGADGLTIKRAWDTVATISDNIIYRTGRTDLNRDNQNGGIYFFCCANTQLVAERNYIVEPGKFGISGASGGDFDLVRPTNQSCTYKFNSNAIIRPGLAHNNLTTANHGITLGGEMTTGEVLNNTIVDPRDNGIQHNGRAATINGNLVVVSVGKNAIQAASGDVVIGANNATYNAEGGTLPFADYDPVNDAWTLWNLRLTNVGVFATDAVNKVPSGYPDKDILGVTRPQGGANADIGAYELVEA